METGQILRIGIALVFSAGPAALTGCSEGGDSTIEGLIGDPDAALEFLYPDGIVEPGTSPVAIKYIRDTDWNDDGFDNLTQVLDQAATTYRDPNNPKSELSALAATDTINLLGQRDNLPNTGNDNLGHLLANYIIDIDNQVVDFPLPVDDLGASFESLPPNAQFDSDRLDTVLRQTLNSPNAIRTITDSAIQLSNSRLAAAIHNEADVSTVSAVVRQNNNLSQYLVSRAGFPLTGQSNARQAPDSRSDAMTQDLGNAINQIPEPTARFAEYLNGHTISDPRDPPLPTTFADPSLEDAAKLGTTARTSIVLTTGIQLGEAGLLEQVDESGQNYPWYPKDEPNEQKTNSHDGFDAELALNDTNYALFRDRLNKDKTWGIMFQKLDSV